MKIKLHVFAVFLMMLVAGLVSAQTHKHINQPAPQRQCAAMSHLDKMLKQDPALEQRMKDARKTVQQWIATHPQAANRSAMLPPDTIPVVFHVIWKTAAQNISDAQIQSQMDVLNECFQHTNPDSIYTPVPFKPLAGAIPYYFILARQDPNGAPTTGIVRRQTTVNSFIDDDLVKSYATGGDDSWNTSLYLNIWTCSFGSSGLIGYGEFPSGTPTPTRGLVMGYNYTGRVGPSLQSPYDLGKSATHEIGHCFDLYHIWGDDGGTCTGSDLINDTPNQGDATFTPNPFPMTDACSASSPGIMYANYMDYTDDSAMTMFTQNQATHMIGVINSFYPNLPNSIGIQPVVLAADDAKMSTITYPSGSVCATSFSPIVELTNFGLNTLTTVTIDYYIDANTPSQYVWTGSLASLASTSVTLPSLSATTGAHTLTCTVSLPNGNVDPTSVNNTQTTNFTYSLSGATPMTQGFDVVSFPPTGYTITNNDGAITWARSTSNHSGTGSMWIDNANNNATGEIDDILSPSFDISALNSPFLKFYVAYKLWTNPALSPNYSDTLQVLVSTDCGLTFTSVFKKFGTALTTTTPTWAGADFFPTAAQWRLETIDLTPFSGSTSLMFKFRNITDYENNLFIDDINIDGATGIKDLSASASLSIYPNPGNGLFTLDAKGLPSGDKSYEIINMLGQTVYAKSLKASSEITESINLKNMPAGVYFLKLIAGDQQAIRKLVINK